MQQAEKARLAKERQSKWVSCPQLLWAHISQPLIRTPASGLNIQVSDVTGRVKGACEQRKDNSNGVEDVCSENGSRHGQNLALTGLFVLNLQWLKQRPESGLDWLICAEFARRHVYRGRSGAWGRDI